DDGAIRGRRERLTTSTRSPAAAATQHTRPRDKPARGVDDGENAATSASAAGFATGESCKRRGAPPDKGRQGAPPYFEDEEMSDGVESDADDEGLGFDPFEDDGFDDWSDDGSDDWSEEEDDEERKGGRGWRWSSGKSETRGASKMPATTVRDRLNNARRRANRAYREAKSLMSSEMEGVVLKATRPDDLPVKPKHLETLMRPTAEMPKEFNVYLPVVRKLWGKMADREWRVAVKALYVVHRFAADGSSDHAINLKESVAVLRTHHDSRRKVNYFDMDAICDVKAPPWSGEDVAPFSEFLRAYAEFVLYRTTHFGPGFGEVLDNYAMVVADGAMLFLVAELVAAGLRCGVLREEQESASTVAAAMLAAQDVRNLMELCSAQLDYLAREGKARDVYPAEVNRWYAFLRESHEPVATLVEEANELATKHKLTLLRPLTATPLVLKRWDKELAAAEGQDQIAPTEEQTGLYEVRHSETPRTATPGSADIIAEPSIGASRGRQKPMEALDHQDPGGDQEMSAPSSRATGGKLATQDTTKPTAGEKETASGDRHGKGSSSPGEVPLAASQKNGEDELSGKGDGAGARRKAGAPALSAEGALPRSSAAVKYRTKAKGDGAMPVKTLKNSVKKDRRDSDGSAVRRPKVRTSRDVDQQQ
ncbi:unnamed protein product, partial [Ascophyllum nodosum]